MRSLSRITTELTILGLTPRHKRLTTYHGNLGFDQPSLWQPLRRFVFGEGRTCLCNYLDNLVDDISLLHQDIIGDETFRNQLRNAVMGVDNQIELYGKDVQTVARLMTIRNLLAKQVERAGGTPVPLPDQLAQYNNAFANNNMSNNSRSPWESSPPMQSGPVTLRFGQQVSHQLNNTPETGTAYSGECDADLAGHTPASLVSAVGSKLANAADSAMGYFRNLHVPLNLRPSPTAFEDDITTQVVQQQPATAAAEPPSFVSGKPLVDEKFLLPYEQEPPSFADRPFPGLIDNPAFFASGSSDDEGSE
jgi:hypothetical protein